MSDKDLLRKCLPYIEYVARGFRNVPDGLDPTFYHTLSAEGDRAEGRKLDALVGEIKAAVSDAQ